MADKLAFATPLTLPCGLVLRNRIVRAAAFAGGDVPTVTNTHREVAKGGAAMTVVAYASIAPEGRTFAEQFVLTPDHAPKDVGAVADAVHDAGGLIAYQLVHAGGFSSPALTNGYKAIAPSANFDLTAFGWPRAIDAADMDALEAAFIIAAKFVVGPECRADGVEVHLGHGYLLSQWLSPANNTRTDEHGGSAEARIQFPLRIVKAVRQAIGPKKALLVKLNTHDGFEGGVTPDDVAVHVRALAAEPGLVDALVPSAGFVNRNGFFMLRGAVPRYHMFQALRRTSNAKAIAMALFGRYFVPEIPFQPCFLLEGAKAVLDTVSKSPAQIPVLVIGGFVDLPSVESALAQGFAGVQMARALIRDPYLVSKWLMHTSRSSDPAKAPVSVCSHCNICVLAALTPVVPSRCVERTPPDQEKDIEDL